MRTWSAKMAIGAVVMGMMVMSLGGGAMAAEKAIKWRLASCIPRGTSWEAMIHQFCKNVTVLTAGRLQIQEVYDGEGVNASEILSAVKSGLVELGMPYMPLHQGELPAGIVELGLPGGPESFSDLRALFYRGGWKDVLREAYASNGLYWLGENYQPGTYVLTKRPIRRLEDFNKMKIRCPGAYGKMMRNIGASPVVMSFSEIYTGLATGVIDGADGCNLIDHRDAKFYEVAPYIYPLPLTSAQVQQTIVNMDAWKSLPGDLKAILEMANRMMGIEWEAHSVIMEREALQEMLAKGAKMSPEPSVADRATWKEAGKKVWPEYAAKDDYCKKLIEMQTEFLKKLGQ